MKAIRWTLVGFGAIPVLLVGMIVLTYLERFMGYYPGNPGWEVAEIAAANGKSVEECARIIGVPWIGMGPSTTEQRRNCIHEYAELTKDPSVCELLMPSWYGLSCVGGARGNYECNFYEENEVSWIENDAGAKATLKECSIFDPKRSKRGHECCTVALVTRVKTRNDCSSLSSNQIMFDECQYRLSFKNHDPSTCEPIHDPRVKAACIVSAAALKKDPFICRGCTPPVENVEQLPQ